MAVGREATRPVPSRRGGRASRPALGSRSTRWTPCSPRPPHRWPNRQRVREPWTDGTVNKALTGSARRGRPRATSAEGAVLHGCSTRGMATGCSTTSSIAPRRPASFARRARARRRHRRAGRHSGRGRPRARAGVMPTVEVRRSSARSPACSRATAFRGRGRLLASPQLWKVVDEVARSPAVAEAVARQGFGFADQVAGEVRDRSRSADAVVERTTRRLFGRRPRRIRPPGRCPIPGRRERPERRLRRRW